MRLSWADLSTAREDAQTRPTPTSTPSRICSHRYGLSLIRPDFFLEYCAVLYKYKQSEKKMWLLNECVVYVQIQAAKPVYSDSSLDKL